MSLIAACKAVTAGVAEALFQAPMPRLEEAARAREFWHEFGRSEFLPRSGRCLETPASRLAPVTPLTNRTFPCEGGHLPALRCESAH
jgi:hypothetical protein